MTTMVKAAIAEILADQLYLTDVTNAIDYVQQQLTSSTSTAGTSAQTLLVINSAVSECVYPPSLLAQVHTFNTTHTAHPTHTDTDTTNTHTNTNTHVDKKAMMIDIWELDLKDHYGCDLSLYFDEVSDRIHSVLSLPRGRVLVHCFAGKSRSVSLVLAYLMKYHQHSLQSAFTLVSATRDICPNIKFIYDLLAFEKKLNQRDRETGNDNQRDRQVFDMKSYICNFVIEILGLSKENDLVMLQGIYDECHGDYDRVVDTMLCR